MSNTRLSLEIDTEEHKYLKMCCAKLGVSIKEFVVKAVIDTVDSWEDKWMLERWEKDGTLEEIERDKNDPNRVVYEAIYENGEHKFIEKKWSEVVSERTGSLKSVI